MPDVRARRKRHIRRVNAGPGGSPNRQAGAAKACPKCDTHTYSGAREAFAPHIMALMRATRSDFAMAEARRRLDDASQESLKHRIRFSCAISGAISVSAAIQIKPAGQGFLAFFAGKGVAVPLADYQRSNSGSRTISRACARDSCAGFGAWRVVLGRIAGSATAFAMQALTNGTFPKSLFITNACEEISEAVACYLCNTLPKRG